MGQNIQRQHFTNLEVLGRLGVDGGRRQDQTTNGQGRQRRQRALRKSISWEVGNAPQDRLLPVGAALSQPFWMQLAGGEKADVGLDVECSQTSGLKDVMPSSICPSKWLPADTRAGKTAAENPDGASCGSVDQCPYSYLVP